MADKGWTVAAIFSGAIALGSVVSAYYAYKRYKINKNRFNSNYIQDGTGPHGQGNGPGNGEGCEDTDNESNDDIWTQY